MKRKLLLLSASLLAVASASAQWVRPVPAMKADYAVNDTAYLYNVAAGGFFLGANEWDTRASISATKGYKVTIETENLGDEEDPEICHLLKDSVEKFNEWRCTFYGGANEGDIYVDNNTHGGRYWIMEQAGSYFRFRNRNIVDETIFLGYIPSKNDTRLYMCNTAGEEQVGVDWYFVDAAEYEAYLPKIETYLAAVKLGEEIAAAEQTHTSLDYTAIKAVYNNTSSTLEQLQEAMAQLQQMVAADLENVADASNPVDMTGQFVVNNDFELDYSGWEYTTGAQNHGLTANNVDGTHATGQLWENWSPSNYSGKMYKHMDNVPNGVYRLQMAAFAWGNAFVFANNDSVAVPTQTPLTFEVYTIVTDHTLEIGLNQPTSAAGYMGIDNVNLMYFGNSLDAWKVYANSYVAKSEDYSDENIAMTASLRAAWIAAKDKIDAATTKEEILPAVKEFNATIPAIKENVAAYEVYMANVAEKLAVVAGNPNFAGDPVDTFVEYCQTDYEPSEIYPNGCYEYIIGNGLLTTEQVIAENEFVNQLYDATKSCLATGADITSYITNPNFSEQNGKGWTYTNGVAITGGLPEYPCAEAFQLTFDVNQTIKDLPIGIYRISLNAFYRPSGNGSYDGSEDVPAVVYLNEFEAKVQHIMSDPSEEAAYNPGNWKADYQTSAGFVPNSMEGASTAFLAGRYLQNVYGLVTDGDMRLGIKSTRPAGASADWCLWTNFRLTFMGKNVEALTEVINSFKEQAEEIQGNYEIMNAEVAAALISAVNTAEDATDGDSMFDAVIVLNSALKAARNSGEAYAALSIALDELGMEIENATSSAAFDEVYNFYVEKSTAFGNGEIADADIDALMEEIETMKGKLKLPGYNDATDENPVDMTSMIINPDFDSDNHGSWEGTGWAGTDNIAEHYNKTYDTYQTIYGLPAGTYKVVVNAFYRTGGYTADYNLVTTDDASRKNAYLYAETAEGNYSEALINLCEELSENQLGFGREVGVGESKVTDEDGVETTVYAGYVPDDCASATAHFEAGKYVNELVVKVGEDGKLKIGVKKGTAVGADWTAVDNWKLFYYGKESAQNPSGNPVNIDGVDSDAEVVSTAYYTLGGALVAAPVKGVNIVKQTLSDGTVKVTKVIVK